MMRTRNVAGRVVGAVATVVLALSGALVAMPAVGDDGGPAGRLHDAQRQARADAAAATATADTSVSPGTLPDVVRRAVTRTGTAPSEASASFGPATGTDTLVLFDTSGPYGSLGELYGMATGNLAAHFGRVTLQPISSYRQGQINQYDATIYLGSTYYSTADGDGLPANAIPQAFTSDVLTSARPVLWVYDNIWTLSQRAAQAGIDFPARYGWDPSNSYFSPASFDAVTYKGRELTRFAGTTALPQTPLLGVSVTDATTLTTLASASNGDGVSTPWAVRSGNLTYVADIPFTFTSETDRYLAFADLLFDALAPQTPDRHRALLRLEDISPNDDPAEVRQVAEYLWAQQIPYAVAVIPVYEDPNGVYNGGVPERIQLKQRPQLVKALRWMLSHGGTLVQHGYTHQLGNQPNPYTAVSGDD
jgi:uncharacterized protein YdaL